MQKKEATCQMNCAWLLSLLLHAAIAMTLCTSKISEQALAVPMHITLYPVVKASTSAASLSRDQPPVQKTKTPSRKAKPATYGKKTDQPIDMPGASQPITASSADAAGEINSHAIVKRDRPMLINGKDVEVPYPERARQMMVEGIVRMRLTVSAAGHVIDAQIISGPYFGLRNAALVVAQKLSFLPATDENGHAKTAQIEHDVVFRLNKTS